MTTTAPTTEANGIPPEAAAAIQAQVERVRAETECLAKMLAAMPQAGPATARAVRIIRETSSQVWMESCRAIAEVAS